MKNVEHYDQADLYQLMAYGRLYDCSNVMLLYPHHADLPTDPIRRRYSIAARDADEKLIVATLSLAGSQRDHRTSLRDLIKEHLTPAARLGVPGLADISLEAVYS